MPQKYLNAINSYISEFLLTCLKILGNKWFYLCFITFGILFIYSSPHQDLLTVFFISSMVTLLAVWKIFSLKKDLQSCKTLLHDTLEKNFEIEVALNRFKQEWQKSSKAFNVERKKFDSDQKKYDEINEKMKLFQSKFAACQEKIELLNNAPAQDYNPEEIKKLLEELNKINEEMEQLTKV